MKPGRKDIKLSILITGRELEALKELTWNMAEAYGLDMRIVDYKGTRPIGLYQWDMDCLIDVVESAIKDTRTEPWMPPILEGLLRRLREAYSEKWGAKSN
jgi:hypothetical protein